MNTRNEKILDDIYTAWSERNMEKIVSYFTDDCIYEDMALQVINHGHEGLGAFIREVFHTMPDFHVRYVRRFATADQGAGEWVINGTWNGAFEGVDCTGKKIQFTGLSLYKFRNGKVCHAADCWDFCQMMKGFGVLRQDLRPLR